MCLFDYSDIEMVLGRKNNESRAVPACKHVIITTNSDPANLTLALCFSATAVVFMESADSKINK